MLESEISIITITVLQKTEKGTNTNVIDLLLVGGCGVRRWAQRVLL